MLATEVPAEIRQLVDMKAGRDHSTEGAVMACVAEVLSCYERMLRKQLEVAIEEVWEQTWRAATAHGTTYGVDAVGACLAIVRGPA